MSVTSPRGPLPARVYWTRRLVLLAVIALLVLVLGRVLTGGSDGGDTGSDTAGKATQVAGTPTGSATATGPAASPSKKSEPAGDPQAKPSGPCDTDKLTVTATVGKQPNDRKVAVKLKVATSQEACTFGFSSKSAVLKVTSGSDQIWSSQQCPKLPAKDLVVRRAKGAVVWFAWDGRRSDEDCSMAAGWALPGYYHAVAAVLGGEPTDIQFQLTKPPAVVVTRTAHPEAGKTDEP